VPSSATYINLASPNRNKSRNFKLGKYLLYWPISFIDQLPASSNTGPMNRSAVTRRQILRTATSGMLGLAVLNGLVGCGTSSDQIKDGATTNPASPKTTAIPGGWQRIRLAQVSAYLLIRGSEAAIVDLGPADSAKEIQAALKLAGVDWRAVRHIILTHNHDDHVGAAAEVQMLTKATIHAGTADIPDIKSKRSIEPVQDGDEVFGLKIVETPGHTQGHISVFDESSGVMVAGDALRTSNGTVVGSDSLYTSDEARAAASVQRLAALDVKAILPGHGLPLTATSAASLRKLSVSLAAK
jgi:glyoxylase-like metal-dependent hydrolase (beta-lactamase superfamily II)